jgi:hypothetical protein
MANGDRQGTTARRTVKLWKVLVVGGMALATACAGNQKGSSGDKGSSSGTSSSDSGTSSSGSSSSSNNGGGASGW